MPEFRIIPSSRTYENITKHGWAVERRAAGEMTRAASELFATELEARQEAARLAKLERGIVR